MGRRCGPLPQSRSQDFAKGEVLMTWCWSRHIAGYGGVTNRKILHFYFHLVSFEAFSKYLINSEIYNRLSLNTQKTMIIQDIYTNIAVENEMSLPEIFPLLGLIWSILGCLLAFELKFIFIKMRKH